MRALPKERPASLTGPPDGQTLEALIGDLQSEWGVPQYPQEYRITIKVADERDVRAERPVAVPAESTGKSQKTSDAPAAPKRERAPAAPRVVASGEREAAPKRRRGRRRRRKGREGTDGASAAGVPTQEAAPAPESPVEAGGGSLPEG